MPPAAAASPARIDTHVFLWLLVALSAATMNAPQDIWETIRHLRVPDTDDAMRLVEVRDLLAGQGWYDNVQYRFLAPEGVASHWSRLVDAPIAGLIRALTPMAGRALAEGITAAVWPVLLFGAFCAALYRGVQKEFGRRAAILAVLVATQTFGIAIQFQPGRVDHHNVQILAMLGLALGLISGGFRAGLVGGGLAALSLAVGLEGLPYLALGALYLVVDWCRRGHTALPCLAGFGLGLGVAAPLLFAAQTAPALWTATRCDALSPPWLWLAAGGLGFVMAATALGRRLEGTPTKWMPFRRQSARQNANPEPWPDPKWSGAAPATPGSRIALAAFSGIVLTGGFAFVFPVCLDGPFPGMPALVRNHWLLTVNEMASLPKSIALGRWEMLVFYPVVLLAGLTATWMACRGTQRRAWSVAALFLWPGLILGFFQFRGLYIASGFVPLVAGPVIDQALTCAAAPGPSRRRWGILAVGGCLVSTLWLAPVALAEWLAPASRTALDPAGVIACQGDAAVRPLAALPAGVVLAPVFLGPSILLRTPHTIVAAPYHRAIPGLTAAIEGLGGTEADLNRVLDAFRVRYLVVCPFRPADDLQPEPAFATRLARDEVQSGRLEPVALPGPLKAWRVVR